jgi:hypothetical protein
VSGIVRALTTFDGGLIVGGQFANAIARLDGTPDSPTWSALGTGMNNSVLAMTTFNGELIAGGLFTTADGSSANYIARWNATTQTWSPLGTGMNGAVYALAAFDDDGGGPHPTALYAGGAFTKAGGTTVNYIAKWNGSSWTKLGSGMNGNVRALATFDGKLIGGGEFTKADNKSANRIASWDGSSWSKLGLGTTATVYALTTYGSQLCVGGMFANAGGASGTSAIALWSGSAWSSLGNGLNNTVMSLSNFDDGSGNELYVGGYFTAPVGGAPNSAVHIARWNGAWSAVGDGMEVGNGDAVFALSANPAADLLYAGGFFVVYPQGVDAGYLAAYHCIP